MLWEKGQVYPRKHDKELYLRSPLGKGGTRNGREPKSHPGKDGEHGAHGKHIVEVRHDVISIMQSDIQRAVCQHDARQTANGEKEKEAKDPKQGRLKSSGSAV